MTEQSRDTARQDSDSTHDLRMAVRRLKIADADTETESRTAFLEAVLSLPGVSNDPVTVHDVTVLADAIIDRWSAVLESVHAVLTGQSPDQQSVRWTVSGG